MTTALISFTVSVARNKCDYECDTQSVSTRLELS